jgi:photosystem II stability/assembly factor-like uncharacterized protein
MPFFPSIFLAILLLLLTGSLPAQQLQWRRANGTEGIHINDIAVYPGNPDTLYAIGSEEFLFSTDRGENWQIIPNAPEGGASAALKVDPFDSRRIYASHYYTFQGGNGVSISTDGGLNWQLLFSGTFIQAAVVEIDPLDHRIIYAGQGPSNIRKSSDHGQTWDLLSTDSTMFGFNDLAIAPTDPQVLYAGYYSGIFKSSDGGYYWEELPLGIAVTWPRVAVDPRDEKVVYATSFTYGSDSGGVFKSVDGGFNWTHMSNGLTSNDWDIETIEINPKNPNKLFIGTGGGFPQANLLFRSTNGGKDWHGFSNGLSDSGHVSSIEIDSQHKRVYIGVNAFNATGIYIYEELTSLNDKPLEMPKEFHLYQNYPNPFNSTTIIPFTLTKREFVKLEIYNVSGRQITTLLQGYQAPGTHKFIWNAEGLPGGIYFYQMTIDRRNLVRKALLIK